MSSRRSSFHGSSRAAPEESYIGRLIDPIDRLSETVYTVLIALVFTLAYRIFKFGDDGTSFGADYSRELFLAILGAALAWGIIDGIMYAMMEVFQRSERRRLLDEVQAAESDVSAVAAIADELDFILEPITGDEQRQALYRDILLHLRQGSPRSVGLQREDVIGAFGSVLVAALAVAPSLAPFLVFPNETALAIRLSNVISFLVLFGAGYSWGRHTGTNPWKVGLLLAVLGFAMVLIAIPMGG